MLLGVDLQLLSQYVIAGLMIGVLYALMALGVTFIYSVMKMINWSMGQFYMLGSFIQYLLVVRWLGPDLWFVALPITAACVFVIGAILQLLNGTDEHTPGSHLPNLTVGTLPVSGATLAASLGGIAALILFAVLLRRTWVGLALRAAAQSRIAVQTAGVDLMRLDMIAFGIGVALAAIAGALLAPVYLVYPTNGAVTTTKGFEIIIIGGLGSIPGALVGGLLLGLVEALGSVFIAPAYQNAYGFVLLIALLLIRPTGLFGERLRAA